MWLCGSADVRAHSIVPWIVDVSTAAAAAAATIVVIHQ